MSMKTMKLCSGDKVLVTDTAFDCSIDVMTFVVATKGSIATVLSYDEYSDYIRGDRKVLNVYQAKHLEYVRSWMDEGTEYPIRIEKSVPYEDDDDPRITVSCSVGYITTLEVRFLEKII
jgi:hypothetical protein